MSNPFAESWYGYADVDYPDLGTALLLDSVTAYAAWSLRKLSSVHTYAIRVRRSSDNAEQDIGFANGVLDTSSLLTFCGAGSGYIVKKYDATGNNRDWIEETTTRQTRIVNSGVVDATGGFSAERHLTGVTCGLSNAALDDQSVIDYYSVWSVSTEDGSSIPYGSKGNSGVYWFVMQSGAGTSPSSGAGSPTAWKNGAEIASPTRADLYTAFAGSGIVIARSQAASTTYVSWGATGVLEGYLNTTFGFNGHWLESIVFTSDSTSVAATVEADMADFYGVALA